MSTRSREADARRAWLAAAATAWAGALFGCAGPQPGPRSGEALRSEAEPAGVPPPSAARLAGFDHILLGEVHDNPQHHAARARLLRELLADGRPTTVLFEMMGRRHDEVLARAVDEARRADRFDDAALDAVADAGGLDRRGWGWPLHRPVVEAALRGGADLRGANLEASEARAVVRAGLGSLPEDVRTALASETLWSEAQQRELLALIDEGHCRRLPERLHKPMVLAQRARDMAMALALVRAAQGGGRARRTVLIAGNGHVRRDLGVPHKLAALGVPPARVAAVGYLEPGQALTGFDWVATSPPPPGRPDPCEAFRSRR